MLVSNYAFFKAKLAQKIRVDKGELSSSHSSGKNFPYTGSRSPYLARELQ